MTDYITRQAAIEAMNNARLCSLDGSEEDIIMPDQCFRNIDTIPAADVVEVVRCKDCKHYDMYDMRCNKLHIVPIPEFCYCSYGERTNK